MLAVLLPIGMGKSLECPCSRTNVLGLVTVSLIAVVHVAHGGDYRVTPSSLPNINSYIMMRTPKEKENRNNKSAIYCYRNGRVKRTTGGVLSLYNVCTFVKAGNSMVHVF